MHFSTTSLSKNIAKAIPHIFTGAGILWFGAATLSAFKLGTKVHEMPSENKVETKISEEFIKEALPVIGSFAIGAACVIISDACSARMLRASSIAYNSLTKNFQEYKAAVVGALGAEANKLAMKTAAEDNKPELDEPPIPPGCFHFYDEFSRNDFVAELADVVDAEYTFNRMFQMESFVSINDFYDLLNMPHIDRGDSLGFDCGEVADWNGFTWIDFQNIEHVEEDGTKWYSIHINPYPTVDGVIDWDSVMNDYKLAGTVFNR